MKDVRDCIREYVADKGLRQVVVAKRAGLTPQVFCAVLNKNRRLEANEFFNICDALGVAASEMRDYHSCGEIA